MRNMRDANSYNYASVAIEQVVGLLAELFQRDVVSAERALREDGGHDRDVMLLAGRDQLAVGWSRSGSVGAVSAALRRLDELKGARGADAVAIVAVPYMPPSGRRLAQERAFSWIDLSGNASIRTPRVFIHVEGKPNQFVRRGRPSTPFAPKSSRIARWFLMDPEREANQAALAAATRLHPATVSRVLRRLVDDGLVRRDGRRYSVRDAGLLLDAWRSEYDFERHEVRAGYLPARTGQAALADLVAAFDADDVEYAATGLAAAWALTQFASFRLSTLYLPRGVPADVLHRVGFQPGERGANVWLLTPADAGVLDGARMVGGVRLVHPVQVYLDLGRHPERSAEAAREVRRMIDEG